MTEVFDVPPDFRIVSGGQTGADQAGLDWAIVHGVDEGGWCPRGRRSEDGPIDQAYRLIETPSRNYLERTEWNVRDSDATAIFTLHQDLSGGSLRTAGFAARLGRPWIHLRPGVHPRYLARFLMSHSVKTLNVAGKRESSQPGVYLFVMNFLDEALASGSTEQAPSS
jgi:hypothetical protein